MMQNEFYKQYLDQNIEAKRGQAIYEDQNQAQAKRLSNQQMSIDQILRKYEENQDDRPKISEQIFNDVLIMLRGIGSQENFDNETEEILFQFFASLMAIDKGLTPWQNIGKDLKKQLGQDNSQLFLKMIALIQHVKPNLSMKFEDLNKIKKEQKPLEKSLLMFQYMDNISQNLEKINSRLDVLDSNQEMMMKDYKEQQSQQTLINKTKTRQNSNRKEFESYHKELSKIETQNSLPFEAQIVVPMNQHFKYSKVNSVTIVMDDYLYITENLLKSFQDIFQLPVKKQKLQESTDSDLIILILYYSGIQYPYEHVVCKAIEKLQSRSKQVPLKVLRIGNEQTNIKIIQSNIKQDFNSIKSNNFDIIEHFATTVEKYENNNQISFTQLSVSQLKRFLTS